MRPSLLLVLPLLLITVAPSHAQNSGLSAGTITVLIPVKYISPEVLARLLGGSVIADVPGLAAGAGYGQNALGAGYNTDSASGTPFYGGLDTTGSGQGNGASGGRGLDRAQSRRGASRARDTRNIN